MTQQYIHYATNPMTQNTIYCFWTGDNPLTENRIHNLDQLAKISECNVRLVTKHDIPAYILPDHPLHEAYDYLSETHKADYLRTYFMHFHGGGYCDIKQTTGSWLECFRQFENSDYWICGYKEVPWGVGYPPNRDKWSELVGNGSYICKPQTALTQEWYSSMLAFLDTKLEPLKENPASNPQDCAEDGSGYPIEWNEMLGRIFHKVLYNHKEHILNTLPTLILDNYR